MKYFVIGDEDTTLGFSLAGVAGERVETSAEAENAFDRAVTEKEIGIILITERIAELIRPKVDRYLFTRDFPLIVEIPDRLGKMPGRPELREMVNQAIGMKLS
ncbi:MAG: V-type ATP synthase subunit F [Spirochaetales bacterium]|nr:V-type ATP synthase subunit F [Spirochaetales bacterium]